jgi:hypothetical protein
VYAWTAGSPPVLVSGGNPGFVFAGDSFISRDGQTVAFEGEAASGDFSDIYLWDWSTHNLAIQTRLPDGTAGNNHSATPVLTTNGGIFFESNATNLAGPVPVNGGLFYVSRH